MVGLHGMFEHHETVIHRPGIRAEHRRRRTPGCNHPAEVIAGVKFKDGIEAESKRQRERRLARQTTAC